MDIKPYTIPPRSRSHSRPWIFLLSLLGAILLWWVITLISGLPAFILPSPLQVAVRFWQALKDGSLLLNSAVTLGEVLLGLLAGTILATSLGYAIAKSRIFEQFVAPYLVASQAIPIVAIAPLLVIWFGPGMFSKVLISALIVFFPVLVNTVIGIRAVPGPLHDLMGSLRASRTQVLRFLELPAALPVLLAGLRIGATLSVIGAVVGELVGSRRGLGFMINLARGQYDTSLVFVAVIVLILMALALYGVVAFAEKKLLVWQERSAR